MRLCVLAFIILMCAAHAFAMAGSDKPGGTTDVFSGVTVVYYVKPADGSRISDTLKKEYIPYTKNYTVHPNHWRSLSNALIYGPDTPFKAIQKVALALIDAGVDVKFIGLNTGYAPRQIVILNLQKGGGIQLTI